MSRIIEASTGELALTFDDVLLQPGHSLVMPGQVDIRTRVARDIELNLPILSAAMDTVTESRLAIAMAQAGGMGVIHRNLTPIEQAEEVRQVKKFESGMVVNPVVIGPDAALEDALELMKINRISGIPVVETGGRGGHVTGKLVGILTNRDVRFATNYVRPISEYMTSENLVTAQIGTTLTAAKDILHKYRIEKLPLVDEHGFLKGLITYKDILKRQDFPHSA